MFDRVEFRVKAGTGGNGSISFRREKYVPFGGPDGGDGGNGGKVAVVADPETASLMRFKHKSLISAEDGGNGQNKKKSGRKGKDLILRVPAGTIVWDKTSVDTKTLIIDLDKPGRDTVVARGGRGGWGNTHFVSATNQAPHIAQKGSAGEEHTLVLELRLIADIGIIGYPNVGKSSLLAAASAAKPKIASYPFTTLEPILGVVAVGQRSFVMAEIPGLIEGAHLGRGLGHEFLRHAMRTKMLVHLIDGTSTSPLEDLIQVNTELSLFDRALAEKPQIVAVNKVDLPAVQTRLTEIKQAFHQAGVAVAFISASTGEGVGELMSRAMKMLDKIETQKAMTEEIPQKVFRPRPKGTRAGISKEDGLFVVTARGLEHIVAGADATDAEVRRHLRERMDRLGVTRALIKAGIKPGDKVRCGTFEWEW